MGEIIELVFEEQPAANAERLVKEILSRARRLDDWVVDGSCRPLSGEIISTIDFVAGIRVGKATLPELGEVSSLCLRIIRVNDRYDIEFSLDLDEFPDAGLAIGKLHRLSNALAEKHGVRSYYCGLEPAIDEDTRLFTGTGSGPLRIR